MRKKPGFYQANDFFICKFNAKNIQAAIENSQPKGL